VGVAGTTLGMASRLGQAGDSGGPMYEMSYNNKYDEYQAYILGCTAYRTSNGYSLGNTFDTYNYYFDINI
jgi:hypothetical protein